MILQLLSFRRCSYDKRIILAFCVAFTALIFQPAHHVEGQEPPTATPTPKPVVSLVSVEPSLVGEDERLTVTVRIDPPGQADSRIEGGILVFDSWNDAQDGTRVDELIAFVFRGNTETRSMAIRFRTIRHSRRIGRSELKSIGSFSVTGWKRRTKIRGRRRLM